MASIATRVSLEKVSIGIRRIDSKMADFRHVDEFQYYNRQTLFQADTSGAVPPIAGFDSYFPFTNPFKAVNLLNERHATTLFFVYLFQFIRNLDYFEIGSVHKVVPWLKNEVMFDSESNRRRSTIYQQLSH